MGLGAETHKSLVDKHCNFSKIKKVSRFLVTQVGRTQDCLEERMRNADKAWWRNVKIYRSEDVPWRGLGVKLSWTELKDGKQRP